MSALQQHGELIAAQTRHGVTGTQALAQPVGDHAEQGIAGMVAELVVDGLEIVQVAEQHGQIGTVVAPQRQGVIEPGR